MLENVRHMQDVTFVAKNKFTSNICNLWYLGAPKSIGRFPRKHSWWSHYSI